MSADCQGVMVLGHLISVPWFGVGTAALGAAAPLLYYHFAMSRRDSHDVAEDHFKNAKDLLAEQSARRIDFEAAIGSALKKKGTRKGYSIDDALLVMKTGELYFETMRVMAQAVLGGRVSDNARNLDFVQKIVKALEQSVPAYYEVLKVMCPKVGIPFEGRFSVDNYESMLEVADRHDHAAWIRVRTRLAEMTP